MKMLRIGRIDYLNVWPLFQGLRARLPADAPVQLVSGHPSELNAALFRGELDLAPSSSFEYLVHGEKYALLPDLSISSWGPVQSVLLACPFPVREMPERVCHGLQVGLSSASASSAALLRVLWRLHWKWPEPEWIVLQPGEGLQRGGPFLEIGDSALRLNCAPPSGWHLLDLGQAWKDYANLPFVFGVWMVRRGLAPEQMQSLLQVMNALSASRTAFSADPPRMAALYERPEWLSLEALREYWQCIRYAFGPREQAGLVFYGECIRQLGLIAAVPGLSWISPAELEQDRVA